MIVMKMNFIICVLYHCDLHINRRVRLLKKCERLNRALNRSRPLLVLAEPNGRQTMLLPQCDHNYNCDEDEGGNDAKKSNTRFEIIRRGCRGHRKAFKKESRVYLGIFFPNVSLPPPLLGTPRSK